MAREIDAGTQKMRMLRACELPLLYAVMAFQLLSMGTLAFKAEQICLFSVKAAALLPLCTWLGYIYFKRHFHIDRVLYILTAFLCSLGVILLRAVFTKADNAQKQANLLLAVIPVMSLGIYAVRSTDFARLAQRCGLIMIFAMCALCLPYVFPTSGSARNWARIGSLPAIQPSELVKPVCVYIYALCFRSDADKWVRGEACVFACACCALLCVQRDLGAAFLYFILALAMYAVGTGRMRQSIGMLILAIVLAAMFVVVNQKTGWMEYLTQRIELYKNPWKYSDGSGDQIVQGLISIASGGLFGAGLGMSSASRVAVVKSDYIFAAMAEEYGTLFSVCVIGVYLIICVKGISIALNARSQRHALIALGAVVQLITQAAVIILGNLNMIPLTGVTLPFVSSGGSSLISAALLMGMILGVSSVNAEDEYDDLIHICHGRLP